MNRNPHISSIIILLLLTVSFATSIQAQKGITVYTEANFKGRSATIPPGRHGFQKFRQRGYASIGSLKIPKGFKADLYRQAAFKGKPVSYTKDIAKLPLKKGQLFSMVVAKSTGNSTLGKPSKGTVATSNAKPKAFVFKNQVPIKGKVTFASNLKPVNLDTWQRIQKNSRDDEEEEGSVLSAEAGELSREEAEGEEFEDGDYMCTSVQVTETVNNAEHYMLGVTSTLWPGAILNGPQLQQGQFQQIDAPRNPFNLVYRNGPMLNGSPVAEVQNPSLSTVETSLTQLLSQGVNGAATPAEANFEMEEINEEERLNFLLGGYFNAGIQSVTAQFGFNWSASTQKRLVTFKQNFYSIQADGMTAANTFVDRPVDPSDVYVSRITYGRLLLFSFESTASAMELDAAINYAYNPPSAVEAGVDMSAHYEQILQNTSIKVYVLGGAASQGVLPINNGFEGIRDYIEQGANFDPFQNPGSPMVFELKFLENGLTANVITSTSYTMSVCELYNGRWNFTLNSIKCTKTHKPLNPRAKLYGKITVSAYRYEPGATETLFPGTMREQTIQTDRVLVDRRIMWTKPEANPAFLSEEEVLNINESFSIQYEDFQNVNIDNSYIVIDCKLYEKDTAREDAIEVADEKIYLSEIGASPAGGVDIEPLILYVNDQNRFNFEISYNVSPE